MQFCPLEDFIWWTSCCCYVPWMLLLSCYPLLHLALLFCRRKSGPLQPLTTHDLVFFLPSRSLILNLVYLCYFRSSISNFWSYNSPLIHISNATGLTQFRFFKRYLYPISHTALIMDFFSREHLYGMPSVTVYSFSSEIDRVKTTDYALSSNFYVIPICYSERELWWFSKGHLFKMKFESRKRP